MMGVDMGTVTRWETVGRAIRRTAGAGWRWARRHHLPTGLAAVIGAALFLGLLVAIFGPLSELAGGKAVRDISDEEKKAAAINAVRQTMLATAR
jgi:hypothetical protein